MNAFKTPQLKKKSTAVTLSLRVNSNEYLSEVLGDPGGKVHEGGADAAAGKVHEGAAHAADSRAGVCLWDYVLSDVGQDCFPLWFEVEEDGRKSVVMGAVIYFPIGEHSEEETVSLTSKD